MKTFEEIFANKLTPDMEYLIYIDGDEIKMDRDSGKCRICDNMTRFYSINFMSRYCSIKCINEEWKAYNLARTPQEV